MQLGRCHEHVPGLLAGPPSRLPPTVSDVGEQTLAGHGLFGTDEEALEMGHLRECRYPQVSSGRVVTVMILSLAARRMAPSSSHLGDSEVGNRELLVRSSGIALQLLQSAGLPAGV